MLRFSPSLLLKFAGLPCRSSTKLVRSHGGTITSQVEWPWSGPHTMKAASVRTRVASMSGTRCRTWSRHALILQHCLLTSQFWVLFWMSSFTSEIPHFPFHFSNSLISFWFIHIFVKFSSVISVSLTWIFPIPSPCKSIIIQREHRWGLLPQWNACLDSSFNFPLQANWGGKNRAVH